MAAMDFTKRKQTWTIAIVGVLLLLQIWNTARQTETISYSEFEQLVADDVDGLSSTAS
jgi:hypothetical protein